MRRPFRSTEAFQAALSADVEAMKASGNAMDVAGLEQRAFVAVRRGMDGAQRIVKGEECKAEANMNFANKDWLGALVAYLAGIWFLQRGEPPCPPIVASGSDGLDAVAAALGAGEPSFLGQSEPPLTKEQEARREAVRVTLHLNLAAAALKLRRWDICRTACQYVLMMDGADASPKALFRLAKAHEGEGSLAEAAAALERLLARDPANTDATKLLDAIRAREATAASTKDLDTMTGEDFAKLSPAEQKRIADEIQRGLDDEEGGDAGGQYDTAALAAALGRV